MKIVFIGQKGLPAKNGGVEKYVENLSISLVKAGHDVSIYSHKKYSSKLKKYKGVNIISLPNLPGKNFSAISYTLLACFDVWFRKVDIINFQSIGPSSLLWLIKLLKPKTPIVFTFHCQDYYHQKWGAFARWYLKFGEKIGCNLADEVITVSHGLNHYAQKKYQINPIYIPNGVFTPKIIEANNIKNWNLEKDNYILTVSRLIRHKGLHYLIKAYESIKTDKKLVIVGASAYTDNYAQELYALAENNDNIIFTGNQTGDTLAELYSNAYFFVQASENEGLSISLLEAMSYHKACLVSNIAANKEAIAGTGLFFKNKNIADLSDKLRHLLKHPEEIKTWGEKAALRVKQEYSWPEITEKIIKLYRSLVKK